MKRARQLGFKILSNNPKVFGGAHLNKGNPKHKRPISIKNSMHLVMRSLKARGEFSFLKFERPIDELVRLQGKRFGVKVYRIANAGNHLHMIVLPRSRHAYNGFIRSITGLIARIVLKVERGNSKGFQFWERRPFTRIVDWGRDFKTVNDYLLQNTLEALGFIDFQLRRNRKNRASTA